MEEREWRACIDFFFRVKHKASFPLLKVETREWMRMVMEKLCFGASRNRFADHDVDSGFAEGGLANAVWAILKDWSCYRSDTLS